MRRCRVAHAHAERARHSCSAQSRGSSTRRQPHRSCTTHLPIMNAPSRMLMQLNIETRVHHSAIDSTWLDVMSPHLAATHYTRLLARAYGFEAPLEAALAYTRGLGTLIDLRERARAGLLAQDLLALGLSPAQVTDLPQCTELAPFRSAFEALGWMYVAERATL